MKDRAVEDGRSGRKKPVSAGTEGRIAVREGDVPIVGKVWEM